MGVECWHSRGREGLTRPKQCDRIHRLTPSKTSWAEISQMDFSIGRYVWSNWKLCNFQETLFFLYSGGKKVKPKKKIALPTQSMNWVFEKPFKTLKTEFLSSHRVLSVLLIFFRKEEHMMWNLHLTSLPQATNTEANLTALFTWSVLVGPVLLATLPPKLSCAGGTRYSFGGKYPTWPS